MTTSGGGNDSTTGDSTAAGSIVGDGHSRIQVGHSYQTNIHHHYTNPTQALAPESAGISGIPSSLEFKGKGSDMTAEEGRKALVDKLKFDHIEDRYSNIKPAHPVTCKWLLTNESYESWSDKRRISEHHGILWLKGKPGAGKSTIMKFAFSEANSWGKEDIPIAFFFNARGSLLEKNTLGMYRSLLFQLFAKLPKAIEVFDDFGILELPQGSESSWTILQLKMVLCRAIRKLGRHRLWIFVDALDECDEEQVRDMVTFFTSLGEGGTRIFFASRYYPLITITDVLEIKLENEEGHSRDIEQYIQSELRTGSDMQSSAVSRIREHVKLRASGIFIWTVLVVQILNKELDRGKVSLDKKLKDIPDDLSKLFREMLTRDSQEMNCMRLCIQWILFAKRPLSREELYFAILYGTDQEEAESWESDEITTVNIMDARILSCSKGLAELTGSNGTTVQFIHETIRDFFLNQDGMQYIQKQSPLSLLGLGHDSLTQTCAKCITSTHERHRELQNATQLVHIRRPFIVYALSHILFHADAAEFNGVSQASFLQHFCVQTWTSLKAVLSVGKVHSLDSTLLYILAEQDLGSLIKSMLRDQPRVDIEGPRGISPIRIALAQRHWNALHALLTPANGLVEYPDPLMCDASQPEVTERMSYTYLYGHGQEAQDSSVVQLFFQWGRESEVLALLRSGRFDLNANASTTMCCSPLSVAAERGYEKLVKFLLIQKDVNPNLQDELGRTPLSKAAGGGWVNVAKLLLQDTEVKPNLQSNDGRSALSYAAEKGHEHVVRLLLDNPRMNIDLRDNKGRTPFFHAAANGQAKIVELLLKTGSVDITSQDKFGQTPLSYAVLHGHEHIVGRLLSSVNDVNKNYINSRDATHGRTPLSIAIEYGYDSIAGLLLKNGAKGDIKDTEYGRTPLWLAATAGNERITRALLAWGKLDLDSRDTKYGRTPLWCAAEQGHTAVVRLLITNAAVDSNSKDTETGQTPLLVAARNGHQNVVELLLANDVVDPNSSDTVFGQTPLSAAAMNGHKSVVEVLVTNKDVDPELTDFQNRTPLDWAYLNGHDAIVHVLDKKEFKIPPDG